MFRIDYVSEELGNARMRAAHERPYFATALFRVIPVMTDQVDTMAVDKHWRLYYNNGFLKAHSPIENATSVIHEIEHLLRDHAGRCDCRGFESKTFNFAGDLEINDDLDADRALKLIKGGLNPETWREDVAKGLGIDCSRLDPSIFKLPKGLTAEEYYGFLLKQMAHLRKMPNLPNCGSGAHGKKEDYDLGDPSGDARGVRPEEGDLVRKRVAEETADYAEKHPGTVPGGLQRWAQKVLNPVIPWQRVLAGIIRSNVARVAGMADYSYMRPGRRQSAFDEIVLPAFVEPTPSIAVVIDTSGSMGDDELSRALAEVKGILRSCGVDDGLHIVSCDAASAPAQRVFSAQAVKLIGGGGTDMGEGIAAASKLKPKPDFIVVITDGFTPWPASAPVGCQVVVLLVGQESSYGHGTSPSWARTVTATAA